MVGAAPAVAAVVPAGAIATLCVATAAAGIVLDRVHAGDFVVGKESPYLDGRGGIGFGLQRP